MKYYMMREDQAEPVRYTIDTENPDRDTAWEAVCTRMVTLLGEWLDEAELDKTISVNKYGEMSAAYAKFDSDGEGVKLPYTLHLPAAGIVPAQTIVIWEEDEAQSPYALGKTLQEAPYQVVTPDQAAQLIRKPNTVIVYQQISAEDLPKALAPDTKELREYLLKEFARQRGRDNFTEGVKNALTSALFFLDHGAAAESGEAWLAYRNKLEAEKL